MERLLTFMLHRFTPGGKTSDIHSIGCLKKCEANVDAVANRRILSLPEIQLQFYHLACRSFLPSFPSSFPSLLSDLSPHNTAFT
jgi:hypothetical protein